MIRYGASLSLLLCACGAKGVGSQPLDQGKRVFSLTADEAKQFCDETAAPFGGYGKAIACGTGPALGPMSQDQCVSELLQAEAKYVDCQATVGQEETCEQWQIQN